MIEAGHQSRQHRGFRGRAVSVRSMRPRQGGNHANAFFRCRRTGDHWGAGSDRQLRRRPEVQPSYRSQPRPPRERDHRRPRTSHPASRSSSPPDPSVRRIQQGSRDRATATTSNGPSWNGTFLALQVGCVPDDWLEPGLGGRGHHPHSGRHPSLADVRAAKRDHHRASRHVSARGDSQ